MYLFFPVVIICREDGKEVNNRFNRTSRLSAFPANELNYFFPHQIIRISIATKIDLPLHDLPENLLYLEVSARSMVG